MDTNESLLLKDEVCVRVILDFRYAKLEWERIVL